MQDFLHFAMAGLEYFAAPAMIRNSARALLATTAAFARSRRRREAALRALRALNDQPDPDEKRQNS